LFCNSPNSFESSSISFFNEPTWFLVSVVAFFSDWIFVSQSRISDFARSAFGFTGRDLEKIDDEENEEAYGSYGNADEYPSHDYPAAVPPCFTPPQRAMQTDDVR
jgi:hypothetical protein